MEVETRCVLKCNTASCWLFSCLTHTWSWAGSSERSSGTAVARNYGGGRWTIQDFLTLRARNRERFVCECMCRKLSVCVFSSHSTVKICISKLFFWDWWGVFQSCVAGFLHSWMRCRYMMSWWYFSLIIRYWCTLKEALVSTLEAHNCLASQFKKH